ncbi:MAG TPA: hypothetical protein VH092_08870 [Urbifossiella sp.]|nr:hypothetical protein [Urbifossiella sp.]
MSEYQYYEFRAVDRPLDKPEMAALRAISSRAEITPAGLTNEYHFGNFKGDPDRLMDQYFDAHLYLANWGTHRLMLRVPARAFALATARPYSLPEALQVRANKTHVVLDFHSESEGDDDFEGGEGWLSSLIGLRSDLLAGDLRCLYVGWLAGVETGEVDPETIEPAVPPGLGQLTAPLERLADFIRVDPDLIEVAAETSAEVAATGPSAQELAGWVAGLPAAEKNRHLVRLMQGGSVRVAAELLRRFREDTAPAEGKSARRRVVQELLAARDRLSAEKQRRAAAKAERERERKAREREAARAHHLDAIAGREEALWREVEAAIETKQAQGYERAIGLLKDLRDLADRTGTGDEVVRRVTALRERYHTRPALIARIKRAGFTK